eukprot:224003_1
MFYVNNVYLHIFRSLSHVFFILKMSTIHTEASVAASEVEPSASNVYDYSESINDNDEKLDEGLRAPIPMHDDAYDLDTSLLSDNELEAFVKTKHYGGKSSSIPSNLVNIFQRCTGYNKWTSSLYKQSQHKHVSSSNKNKTLAVNPNQSTPQSHHYKTSLFSTLPQIQSSDNNDQLQQEESYGVTLVEHPNDKQVYALKKIRKNRIVETSQQDHIINEKRIMAALNSNFCIKLFATFKDKLNVYFLLEPVMGGVG